MFVLEGKLMVTRNNMLDARTGVLIRAPMEDKANAGRRQ
jgi:hypothetical protein